MNAVTSLPVMLPASAEIFLAIAGMVLLMIGVFRGESSLRFLSYATIATFAVTAILVVTQGGGERHSTACLCRRASRSSPRS